MKVAADLDRILQFQRASLTDDGLSKIETWANHGTPVWGAKMDVSDGERWRAGAIAAHITTRFRIRWSLFSSGLTPKDRLVCEGRTYHISGIKEIGRSEMLEITAAARVD